PRIEREAVLPRPPGVTLHRDERVALLPRRPDGRDERRIPMLAGEAAHRLDEMRRETLTLAAAVDHGDHRGEDVGLRPSTLAEPCLEHVVDPTREPFGHPRGNGARMADDGVALL